MSHDITIGPDTETRAAMQAALIRGDVRSGTAEPLAPHVRYDDSSPEHGPDKWPSPHEVNASGKGSCNSLPRAEAPFVDATHVGVTAIPQPGGGEVHHAFLVTKGDDTSPGITIGPNGRAMTPIPPERIYDPSIERGANGGKPLPHEVYQGAALSPIWPPHVADHSHVHAPACDRASAGHAYQGAPRIHTPTTHEGAATAAAAHLAARNVTPPPAHEPRPVDALYPGHPVLHAIGETEDEILRRLGWRTDKRLVSEWAQGLGHLIEGKTPGGPLPTDGPLSKVHGDAARAMRELLLLIRDADQGKQDAIAQLEKLGPTILALHPQSPEGDAARTVVSEVDAMLPGVVPPKLREHVVHRLPEHQGAESHPARHYGADPGVLFVMEFDDRDAADLDVDLALSDALGAFAVGHPSDGHHARRLGRVSDPRLGATRGGGAGGGGIRDAGGLGLGEGGRAVRPDEPPDARGDRGSDPRGDRGWDGRGEDGHDWRGWRGQEGGFGEDLDLGNDVEGPTIVECVYDEPDQVVVTGGAPPAAEGWRRPWQGEQPRRGLFGRMFGGRVERGGEREGVERRGEAFAHERGGERRGERDRFAHERGGERRGERDRFGHERGGERRGGRGHERGGERGRRGGISAGVDRGTVRTGEHGAAPGEVDRGTVRYGEHGADVGLRGVATREAASVAVDTDRDQYVTDPILGYFPTAAGGRFGRTGHVRHRSWRSWQPQPPQQPIVCCAPPSPYVWDDDIVLMGLGNRLKGFCPTGGCRGARG